MASSPVVASRPAITSKIIPSDMSVPQNPARLTIERRLSMARNDEDQTESDDAIHGDCEG